MNNLQTSGVVTRAVLTGVHERGHLAMLVHSQLASLCLWCTFPANEGVLVLAQHGDRHRAARSPVLPRTHGDAPLSPSCFSSGSLPYFWSFVTWVHWEGTGPSCRLCLYSRPWRTPGWMQAQHFGWEPGRATKSSPAWDGWRPNIARLSSGREL